MLLKPVAYATQPHSTTPPTINVTLPFPEEFTDDSSLIKFPLAAIALPDLEILAPTKTCSKLDSFIYGIIAIESSRRRVMGSSFTESRLAASDIGGPCIALA